MLLRMLRCGECCCECRKDPNNAGAAAAANAGTNVMWRMVDPRRSPGCCCCCCCRVLNKISNQSINQDVEYTYSRVVFYGNESSLMVMNILAFTTCDLWFGNTLLSAMLTYFLELAVVWARKSFGSTNLAHKTMVDERFLI